MAKIQFSFDVSNRCTEILDILTELGINDRRMDEAIGIIITKQDDMGRWKTENTSNTDCLLIPLGQKDEQSKWITFRAIRVLKRYNAD